MRVKKGSISQRPERKTSPWRWRYANKDRYFSSEKAAKEAQAEFLKTRSVVGSSVADVFRGSLERYAVEAFSILKEAGLDDPKFLVEAAKIRAERGTCSLTLSGAVEQIKVSLEFRSRTKANTRTHLLRWQRFIADVGDLQLVVVEPDHVRKHLEKRAQEVSATEAYKTYIALSAFFSKYLKVIGVTLPNIMAQIQKPPRGEMKSKTPYRFSEITAIEAVVIDEASPEDRILFQVQKLAGYRGDEVTNLRFKDFGKGVISLSPEDELYIDFSAGDTKERRKRSRPACTKLKMILLLDDWFTSHFVRKGMELRLKPEHANAELYSFKSETFTKHLHQWALKAGVEWKLNSLRHTYLTAAVEGRFGGGDKENLRANVEATKHSVGHSTGSDVIINNYLGWYSSRDAVAYFECSGEQELFADKYLLCNRETELAHMEAEREALQGYTLDPEEDMESINWGFEAPQ